MRRAGILMVGLLALGACAEMKTPASASRVPPVLAAGQADPVRAAIAEAALLFEDGGRSLARDPARTARAAALLEVVAAETARDPRWAPLGSGISFELRAARLETRAALGIRSGADPDAVAQALATAHAALLRGDTIAARNALDPALFEPGGAGTLARLAAPGPLPQTRNATALTQEAARRQDRERVGGLAGALDPQAGWVDPQPGQGRLTR